MHYSNQWLALGITLLLLVGAIGLSYLGRPPGGRRKPRWYAVMLGADGRFSTSKTIALLWTVVLAYMLLVLILNQPDWDKALKNLAPNYLLFLSGPYAALVLAKAAVSTRVSSGTLSKPQSDNPRLSDLFNDDKGQPDLFDIQYVIFNVIAIIFVIVAFSRASTEGLPAIPTGLVILTGGPAAVYTSNKFFGSDAPTVFDVVPKSVRVNQLITIAGQNLALSSGPSAALPTVTVGGRPANTTSATSNAVTITAPDVGPDAGRQLGVVVQVAGGATASLDNVLTIIPATISLFGADAGAAVVGQIMTLRGTWIANHAAPPLVVVDGSILGDTRTYGDGYVTFRVPPLADLTSPRTTSVKVRSGDLETNAIQFQIGPPAQP